ncbi:MAG: aminopeptidase N [Bdellovibrionales bacterium RBG_16_40_8]|nr:MAG: aminopeptidase N [Bdellovibrionales bacterium RBG_16_40_8]
MKKIIFLLTIFTCVAAWADSRVLTQDMAKTRFNQLSQVSYKLFLDVSQGDEGFTGRQEIIFDLQKAQDILLDFQGGKILSAEINGRSAELARGQVFVKLPKSMLVTGTNNVKIEFIHEYSRDGYGLHYFQDPEDQKTYLYTNFEPFEANRLAPFFDQPDIKAPLELTVIAPDEWVVIANTREVSIKQSGANQIWEFSKTAPISTYVYAMMAGPFTYWEGTYNNTPLRLFARQSQAKYVPYEEWLKITGQGLEFYEKYFATNYPFGKYDQVIVPEFNAGAMENVAAVTFSERFLRRGSYTRSDRLYLYNTVLHEMAHMWFGNLVTMKWWNDLWLNESFATYMAFVSESQATEFSEAWLEYNKEKRGAYQQDQMITTHPISGVVRDTDEAGATFDDITYGKGAAVMNELNFYLGEDVFKKSLQNYFKKYAYANTTLENFIAVFEETTKTDMKSWFKSWLETSGIDTIAQSFSCTSNDLNINLKLPVDNRPHALKVALFKNIHGIVKKIKEIPVKIPQSLPQRSVQLKISLEKSLGCPSFIYANYEDHGYFKVQFDQKSLQFFKSNINNIYDDNLRAAIWSDLWQMVRDQKFKLSDFSNMAIESISLEKNTGVLSFLIGRTVGGRWSDYDSVYYFWPRGTESEKDSYDEIIKSYESLYKQMMVNTSGDRYKLFLDAYLQSVSSASEVLNVASLLETITDPDRRYKALTTLCRNNYEGAQKILNEELGRDKSDRAKKYALSCMASMPDPQIKREFINKLTSKEPSYSVDEVSHIAKSLFPPQQREALSDYRPQIEYALKNIWPKLDASYQESLVYGLAIAYCDVSANRNLENFIRSNRDMTVTIKTGLLDVFDDDRRCVAIKNYNRR